MVRVLGMMGDGLDGLAAFVAAPPFAAALKAVAVLCQLCVTARTNQVNCLKVRQRAAIIVPTLATVWRRLKDSGMTDSVKFNVQLIAVELAQQVRSGPRVLSCECSEQ